MWIVYFFVFTLALCITNAVFGEAGFLRSIQVAKGYKGLKSIRIFFLSYAHALITDESELPRYDKCGDKEVDEIKNAQIQLSIDMFNYHRPALALANQICQYSRNSLTLVYPADTLIGTEKMRKSQS